MRAALWFFFDGVTHSVALSGILRHSRTTHYGLFIHNTMPSVVVLTSECEHDTHMLLCCFAQITPLLICAYCTSHHKIRPLSALKKEKEIQHSKKHLLKQYGEWPQKNK